MTVSRTGGSIFAALGTLVHIRTTGYDYPWFIFTQKIIENKRALSGSEQTPI